MMLQFLFHDVSVIVTKKLIDSQGGMDCRRGSAISFKLCGFELIRDQDEESLDEEEEVAYILWSLSDPTEFPAIRNYLVVWNMNFIVPYIGNDHPN